MCSHTTDWGALHHAWWNTNGAYIQQNSIYLRVCKCGSDKRVAKWRPLQALHWGPRDGAVVEPHLIPFNWLTNKQIEFNSTCNPFFPMQRQGCTFSSRMVPVGVIRSDIADTLRVDSRRIVDQVLWFFQSIVLSYSSFLEVLTNWIHGFPTISRERYGDVLCAFLQESFSRWKTFRDLVKQYCTSSILMKVLKCKCCWSATGMLYSGILIQAAPVNMELFALLYTLNWFRKLRR